MINKIKALFLNKKFITFALIGGFNTVTALLLYMLFVSIGVSVGASSLLGDCIPMFFSYFLNMKFTYQQKPSLKSFVAFPISYLPGILLNMVITLILVDWLMAPKLLAKAFALPITIPLNYIVMSYIVKITTKKKG